MYSTEAWGKLSKEANFSKFQIQRNVPGDDDVQFEVYLIIAYPYQSLTKKSQWCLEDLNDMTLAVEDVNLKLIDLVAFADADNEKRVDDWLVTAGSLATAWQKLFNVYLQNPIFFIRTQLVLSLFVSHLGGYFVKNTQPLGPFCLWQCLNETFMLHFGWGTISRA